MSDLTREYEKSDQVEINGVAVSLEQIVKK